METWYQELFNIIAGLSLYSLCAIILVLVFLYGVWKANRDPNSDFDWVDLITSVDQTTGKRTASEVKIFQLIGGCVATFIVVKLTLQGMLTTEIFGVYLAYVGALGSFEKLVMAKYGVSNPTLLNSPPTPPKD